MVRIAANRRWSPRLIASAVAVAISGVLILLAARLSHFTETVDKKAAYLQSPAWMESVKIYLRQVSDGSWAVFAMGYPQTQTLFIGNGSIDPSTEPSLDRVVQTQFLPAAHLSQDGLHSRIDSGKQLWLDSSVVTCNISDFGGNCTFINFYDWSEEAVYSSLAIAGYWYVASSVHPDLSLVAVVSCGSDRPWFPWSTRRWREPFVVEFFDTRNNHRVGRSFELPMDVDKPSWNSAQLIRGWTPDGRWLVLANAGDSFGSDSFTRIWAISLNNAELEHFLPEPTP
jgi:hypothetical protein